LLASIAGIVHLGITPYHYAHSPAHGIFFALTGILQVAWAGAVWRTPEPRLLTSGAIFSGGLVVLWGMAELFPIPYDHQHGADWAAYLTKAAELGVFGLSLFLLSRIPNRLSGAIGWWRVGVLPLVLGGILYGAAVAQAQAGWLGGGAESTQAPSEGDDGHDHSHGEAEQEPNHDEDTHDGEHQHDTEANVAVATVAVVEPTPTRTPLVTPQTSPTAEPFTLQSAGVLTYQLSGSSETITEDFELEAGLVLFEFTHPADTPFAFFLLDQESNHLTMPANHLHGVAGTGLYRVRENGVYRLHAIAEDAWEISVTPLDVERLAAAPTPLTPMRGTESTVSLPTLLEAGAYEWQWSHTGELALEIMVLSADGTERIVALETTGVGEGAATFTIPKSAVYLVYIFADGEWTVNPISPLPVSP